MNELTPDEHRILVDAIQDSATVVHKGRKNMNERIDKLFEQALEEFKAENKYATIIVPDPLKEKFAELIVQECAGKVDNILRERKDGGGTMGDEIREHFGVEE
jgi:guanylate kinase